MQQISSTQAKQSFGRLLEAAALEPVAIERHGRVQAVLGAPRFFSVARSGEQAVEARQLARLQQALVEKDRLIRHQHIALDLVTAPAARRRAMVEQAVAVVDLWAQRQLCSQDYIDRWSTMLALPPADMAMAMVSDMDGWGTALRQNSPWVGLHA